MSEPKGYKPMTKEMKLAIEHADWLMEWSKNVFIEAFVHGYKHGKEDGDEVELSCGICSKERGRKGWGGEE